MAEQPDQPARTAAYSELMWPEWKQDTESYGVGQEKADALLDAHAAEVRAAAQPEPVGRSAACHSTRHCADHDWCHRCDPDFAAVMGRVNVAIQRTDPDESHWGQLYAAVAVELRRATAEQPETEAPEVYPAEVSFIGEIEESDGFWMYLTADRDRAAVEKRIASRQKQFPSWADGRPVRCRIVRKTTTYSVEAAPVVAEEPTR